MGTDGSRSRSGSGEEVLWRLPDELRGELAEVVGEIVPESALDAHLEGASMVIVVGDVCTLTLHRHGIEPKLAIVDFKTRRNEELGLEELGSVGDRVIQVRNPDGVITRGLWDAVEFALGHPGSTRIEVEGEEDLASLACIHHAPLGATIIYGIPDVGVMSLQVDLGLKQRVKEVLKRMEA